MKNAFWWFLLYSVIMVVVITFCVSLFITSAYDDYVERFSMIKDFNESFTSFNPGVLNGYFNPNQDFYCVWTDGRDSEKIMGTDNHEACHALVYNDYDHFCDVNYDDL